MRKLLLACLFLFILISITFFSWQVYKNKTNYSALTSTEKKLLLYSENAFYYSFYDELIGGKDISNLTSNDGIEYPQKVNALSKFKIAPELVAASIYPFFESAGMEAMDFYLLLVFVFTGLTVAMVFLISFSLSGSFISGFLTVALFLVSLPYSSRALSFPAFRENFSIPFWLVSIYVIHLVILEKKSVSRVRLALYFFSIVVQVIFWQFTFYNLIFVTIGLVLIYIFAKNRSRSLKWILVINGFGFIVNHIVNSVNQESGRHVFNYLLSRANLIKSDFHSMMYWCDGVFRSLNSGHILIFLKNLLLPFAITGGWFIYKDKNKIFWIYLSVIYLLAAMISNRFLVLAVPIWTIVAGQIVSKKALRYVVFLLLIFSTIVYSWDATGSYVLTRKQVNPSETALMEWIINSTPKESVFSGSMSTMSSVRLTSGRKITNNPFYEDKSSRQNNFKIYQLYNKISEKEYHDILKVVGTDYVVVDTNMCFESSYGGCYVEDLFINEKKETNQPTLCRAIPSDSKFFGLVFSNTSFVVYRVL